MALRIPTNAWQYNGCAPWADLINWCYDHLGIEGDNWYGYNETIYFHGEKHFTAFCLKWAG